MTAGFEDLKMLELIFQSAGKQQPASLLEDPEATLIPVVVCNRYIWIGSGALLDSRLYVSPLVDLQPLV
jgi:hypothetical protein